MSPSPAPAISSAFRQVICYSFSSRRLSLGLSFVLSSVAIFSFRVDSKLGIGSLGLPKAKLGYG